MASSAQKYLNYQTKGHKVAALRLSDVGSSQTADYAEILVGDGVPSGGYGRDSGATLLYIRKDADAAGTCLYVSNNGGTAWTSVDAT